ncbi:MAG: SHOCT domain-containing protein [Calditrichia bacterium]
MMNGMGGMWFGWLFWLVIIGLIVWGVITVVNSSRNRGTGQHFPPANDALDILKKRYARGEISKEEFERMKKDLLD